MLFVCRHLDISLLIIVFAVIFGETGRKMEAFLAQALEIITQLTNILKKELAQ